MRETDSCVPFGKSSASNGEPGLKETREVVSVSRVGTGLLVYGSVCVCEEGEQIL